MNNKKNISVLGGTGDLGSALAWRWAKAGHVVTIGSRTKDKAQAVADDLNTRLNGQQVTGTDNPEATATADIVVLTVPFSAHQATLESIKTSLSGQIFIDTTVPIKPPRVDVVQLPETGAVALLTKSFLGDKARIAAAFHNVSAQLLSMDTEIHCDILVTSDDNDAKKEVMQLAEDAGCHALDGGALANAAATEAMTSVLIHLNKTYKVRHAGLVINGLNK